MQFVLTRVYLDLINHSVSGRPSGTELTYLDNVKVKVKSDVHIDAPEVQQHHG